MSKAGVDLATEWERQCREARGHALEFARELQAEREQLEQVRVQLAGCGVAALGSTKDVANPGDYGYSASYEDVLTLRRKYDAERERAGKLVDAAKAANRELGNLITSVHGLEDQGGFVRGAYRQTGYHERAHTELDIALKAYEVQP